MRRILLLSFLSISSLSNLYPADPSQAPDVVACMKSSSEATFTWSYYDTYVARADRALCEMRLITVVSVHCAADMTSILTHVTRAVPKDIEILFSHNEKFLLILEHEELEYAMTLYDIEAKEQCYQSWLDHTYMRAHFVPSSHDIVLYYNPISDQAEENSHPMVAIGKFRKIADENELTDIQYNFERPARYVPLYVFPHSMQDCCFLYQSEESSTGPIPEKFLKPRVMTTNLSWVPLPKERETIVAMTESCTNEYLGIATHDEVSGEYHFRLLMADRTRFIEFLKWKNHFDPCTVTNVTLAYCDDGQLIGACTIKGDEAREVFIFDVHSGRRLLKFVHEQPIVSMALSTRGKYLIVRSMSEEAQEIATLYRIPKVYVPLH